MYEMKETESLNELQQSGHYSTRKNPVNETSKLYEQ